MQKSKKGIVYTVTNKETKEVYVGITTKSIKARKKDHFQKTFSGKKSKFYDSIATYGIDAFKWESNNTFYNIDELAQKEKELIEENKNEERSLNMDSGGGIQKTVYKYSIQGLSLIDKFNCLKKAAKSVNSIKQEISRACLKKNKHKGFYWGYKLEIPFIPSEDKRLKKVIQISISSGKRINVFKSVSEASKQTGCNKTSIAKVCRGERKKCGDFYWKYK